ncbi:hypothetical protein AZ78_3558 [Lysobacter capsici AZ78]|uniref:Uncharacterized protein n=1 Tax=Lysobacter capsici AZ78 TaxID=1444315 RepID=A0A108UBC9_9GAMM|nr:hypothetical protein AZ78_3558 [Lysobacter capsici AZ78]
MIDHDATQSVRRAVLFAPPMIFAFLGLIESMQEWIGYLKAAKDRGQD